MAFLFQPRPSAVVMCDFRGYEPPEMVKVRPVVVLARNRKARGARHSRAAVHDGAGPRGAAPPQAHTQPATKEVACWAKCDMVATVAIARLDRYKASRREYLNLTLDEADFQAIRRATAAALGLRNL